MKSLVVEDVKSDVMVAGTILMMEKVIWRRRWRENWTQESKPLHDEVDDWGGQNSD